LALQTFSTFQGHKQGKRGDRGKHKDD